MRSRTIGSNGNVVRPAHSARPTASAATMVGELRSVQTCSRATKTGVTAEFFDGTDTVLLKWMGRNRIPGIEPGRRVTVRGRVAQVDGAKLMYNPYYELHAADE